jgi:hypothetical protein
MKTLRFMYATEPRYPIDVAHIVEAFRQFGLCLHTQDAELAWNEYSDSMCAGWMQLPRTQREIVEVCLNYLIDDNGEYPVFNEWGNIEFVKESVIEIEFESEDD